MNVTTAALERYQRERLDAKKGPATINRQVHALRRAFNVAARQTPPLFTNAYLSTQPTQTENEKGQLRDIRRDGDGKSLRPLDGVGSSGRIRTYDPPVNSRMLYR